MKNLAFIAGFLLLLAFTAGFYGCAGTSEKTSVQPAAAASGDIVTGRWEGTFFAEGWGDLPIGINLKADGDKMTGTYDDMSGPVPIRNGKIDGNKISFDVTLSVGDFHMEGVITGTTMAMKWENPGGGFTEAALTHK
jgi:hypothetical protein